MNEAKLRDLGLGEDQIEKLISANWESSDAEANWRNVCQLLADDFPDPSVARELWDLVFHDWKEAERPRPLWSPTLQQIHGANLSSWSADLGITSFEDFHRNSVEAPEAFWQSAIERLGVELEETGEPVLSDRDAAKAQWFPNASLNIAKSCFQADPESPAIVYQRPGQALETLSVAQLQAKANQVSNGLVEAGFQAGDAIAVVLPMTAESVAIYLGIVQAGMAVVSIADSFAANEIANRLRIAEAKAVFTYDQMLRAGKPIELLSRVQEATDLCAIVVPLDNATRGSLRSQDIDFQSWNTLSKDFETVICNARDATNILFSSGTTGDPKAIPWTHITPIKCAVDGFVHQDIKPGDVAAWPTNLGWMMGPWLIYAALVNRATIALYEDVPMGDGFGKFIEDAKVTMLGVVPTIVKAWKASRCMEPYDWSAIKCFSSTGEASQADDMFYLAALANMRPVIEYCGGTEIGGGYITSTMVQPNVASSFSTAAIGLGVLILDGERQPADEGEVFLQGPCVGLSERLLNRDHHATYYEGAPKTAAGTSLRKHGDFMRKLPGGYIVAGGRADDTMNLGGIKVSSAEIERVLNRIETIRETAAVAYSDGGPDELVMFVVLESDEDTLPTQSSLQKEMNQKLKSELNPLFKVSRVRLIDSMPRTASNKVMRRKLRDQLASN